jgi:RHS repeat-associated protein
MQSASDYSPFGVLLDGRSMQKMGYRYGFGGMEKDDEVKGDGNSYTTEFRQLDPRVGRWMTIDPKYSLTPSLTPFRFCFNNPVKITDSKGDFEEDEQEPRWGQLGSLKMILNEMWKGFNSFNVVNSNVGSKLIAMTKYFEVDRKFTRNNKGILIDVDPSKNIDRYIYTTKSGWIDMHHFFRLANYTRENGQKMAELYAYNSERYQYWNDNPSGWSYEDIASDIAGIEFWIQYGERLKNAEINLTNATKEYLTSLGAVDPSKAPNYNYIPHTINPDYVLKSSNKRGLKGNELKERHKKIFESRSKIDQEKIINAHQTIKN